MPVQHPEDGDAVLQRAAAGDAVVQGEAEDHGEVAAGAPVDGVDYVRGETGAVFGRAAVFVCTLVPDRGEELVHQVADVSMYLDRVEAGVAHEPGAVFPELHHLCDLFDREGVALDFRVPHPGVFGGGDGQLPVYLVGVASGAAGKLHDGLAAVGVEPFREAARGGNNVVVVPGVAEDALAQLGVEVALTADDHTGTAAGALLIIRNLVFRKGAVPVRHKRTHGRHDDAVLTSILPILNGVNSAS